MPRTIRYLFATLSLGIVLTTPALLEATESGQYIGSLVLEDHGPTVTVDGKSDYQSFRLLTDFGYVDSRGVKWTVPSQTIVNGASIPRWLWSVIGSPWVGRYRRASVIHDYYCETKSRSWQEVHDVFYDAMLADRVSELQAKLMYWAVYRFGPRWGEQILTRSFCIGDTGMCDTVEDDFKARYNRQTIEKLKAHIASNNLTLKDLRSLDVD